MQGGALKASGFVLSRSVGIQQNFKHAKPRLEFVKNNCQKKNHRYTLTTTTTPLFPPFHEMADPSPSIAAAAVAATSSVVELNVGGTHYATSVSTMTRFGDHFLSMLVTTDIPTARDSQGRIFIDRDGSCFGDILNFLRDGKVNSSSRDLRTEAEYFAMDALLFYLDEISPSSKTTTYFGDRCLSDDYAESGEYARWADKRAREEAERDSFVAACEDLMQDDGLVAMADYLARVLDDSSCSSDVYFVMFGEAGDDRVRVGPVEGADEVYLSREISDSPFDLEIVEQLWTTNDCGDSPLAMLVFYRHSVAVQWTCRIRCRYDVVQWPRCGAQLCLSRPRNSKTNFPSFVPEWT